MVFIGILSERTICIVPKCNHYFPVNINQMISSLLAKNVKEHPLHSARSLLPTLQDYNQQ
jgi:hypothetical protein